MPCPYCRFKEAFVIYKDVMIMGIIGKWPIHETIPEADHSRMAGSVFFFYPQQFLISISEFDDFVKFAWIAIN